MPNCEDSEILIDGYCTMKATAFCHLGLGMIEVMVFGVIGPVSHSMTDRFLWHLTACASCAVGFAVRYPFLIDDDHKSPAWRHVRSSWRASHTMTPTITSIMRPIPNQPCIIPLLTTASEVRL